MRKHHTARIASGKTLPGLALAAGLLALAAPAPAPGRDCRVNLLPNGGRFSCSNCHTSSFGGGTRTPFGEAVRPLVGLSCNTFWNPALAAMDSDQDGRTNGEELGDPAGTWRPGQPAPGVPAAVTNPGVKAFIRGDFNIDGAVDLADAVATLEFLYRGGAAFSCRGAANANDDVAGVVDVSDAVFILLHLFGTNVNPRAPFPVCGNSVDDNDCRTYVCPAS